MEKQPESSKRAKHRYKRSSHPDKLKQKNRNRVIFIVLCVVVTIVAVILLNSTNPEIKAAGQETKMSGSGD